MAVQVFAIHQMGGPWACWQGFAKGVWLARLHRVLFSDGLLAGRSKGDVGRCVR
jgi:hypothetical protein